MTRYPLAAAGLLGLVLLLALARISGLLLVPVLLCLLGVLAYAAIAALGGEAAVYPRYAVGIFSRTGATETQLSTETPCLSCTDTAGRGERRTTHTELVLFGVPLATLETTRETYCDLCADPLDALDDVDAIDRELEQERDQEREPES